MQIELSELVDLIQGNASCQKQKCRPEKGDCDTPRESLKIVVCQRGWVFVGRCQLQGDELVVRDARNIRRWGTTAGLGQLALEGPQPETILDDAGTVRVHQLAVVLTLDCEEEKWNR